jgi:hypothetical protein
LTENKKYDKIKIAVHAWNETTRKNVK